MEGSWNYSRCRTCCSVTLCFIELRCIALTRIPWSRDDKHISTHQHSTCHSLSRSVGLESHNSYILSSCSINWQWRCQTQMLCVGNASFIRSSENVLLHGIPEKWMWKVTTRMRSAAWWWRYHCFPPSTQSKPQITWWGCKSGSKRNPSPAFPTIIVAFCHPSHHELARTYTLQSMQNTLKLDFILIFQSISRKR